MSTSLNPHDEFLLTLTLLQLGLLNEDVADRFDILPAKSSFIFTTWIKLLNTLLISLAAWLLGKQLQNILTMNPRPITSSPFLYQLYISNLSPPSLLFLVLFLSFMFFFSIFFLYVFLRFILHWFPNWRIFEYNELHLKSYSNLIWCLWHNKIVCRLLLLDRWWFSSILAYTNSTGNCFKYIGNHILYVVYLKISYLN